MEKLFGVLMKTFRDFQSFLELRKVKIYRSIEQSVG